MGAVDRSKNVSPSLSISPLSLACSNRLLRISVNCLHQFLAGKRLGNVVFRAYYSPACLVKDTVLAGQHNNRYVAVGGVIFYQRTGLVSIKTRHTDVSENNIRLAGNYLAQRIKPIFCGNDLETFLFKQTCRRAAYGLAVVNHQDFHSSFVAGSALVCPRLNRCYRSLLERISP